MSKKDLLLPRLHLMDPSHLPLLIPHMDQLLPRLNQIEPYLDEILKESHRLLPYLNTMIPLFDQLLPHLNWMIGFISLFVHFPYHIQKRKKCSFLT
jgi:hypothetical protein